MSRLSTTSDRAKAAAGVLLLALAVGAAACDEDGKTAPERCADPALPIFDIQTAGEPADGNAKYPCVTKVGHSVSSIGTPGTAGTGSVTTGGKGGGVAGGGKGGSGDTSGAADAGAGGK